MSEGDQHESEGRGPGWVRTLDGLSTGVGVFASWLIVAMVAVGTFNALARYVGRALGEPLASNAFLELQWYLFSLVFLLGAADTLRRGAHVRVDVIYAKLTRRVRRLIDVAGGLIFTLPFCIFLLIACWPSVRNSFTVLEGSPDPGGLPRYPLKGLMLVAIALLALQALAEIGRRLWPRTPPAAVTAAGPASSRVSAADPSRTDADRAGAPHRTDPPDGDGGT